MNLNNPAVSKYKDFSFKGNKFLIQHSIKQSILYTENYKLKKSPIKLRISDEMLSNFNGRHLLYESKNEKWEDRYSILAAPLGAEMFLQTSAGEPRTFLGNSRYYFHEMDDPDNYPDALSRFPYDDIVHHSAKIITRFFRMIFHRKMKAATTIQSCFRGFKVRRYFHKIIAARQDAAAKIREAAISHKEGLLKNLHGLLSAKRHAKTMRDRIRIAVMTANMPAKIARTKRIAARLIQKWYRFQIKKFKMLNGKKRRLVLHVIRLQAFIRGRRERRHYFHIRSCQILLAWFWRRQWRRKYGKVASKIQRLVRRRRLLRAVVNIQRMVRGMLCRRRTGRLLQKLVVLERQRCALEQHALVTVLEKEALRFSPSLPASSSSTIAIMQAMDVHCYKAIYNITDTDIANQHLKPKNSSLLLAQGWPSRLARALLEVFSNRPRYHIDEAGMALSQMYLSWPEVSETKTTGKQPAHKQMEWVGVQDTDAGSCRAHKSLQMRVALRGHVPDQLLARAALLRHWTRYTDAACLDAVRNHRKHAPARQPCPRCLQPFLSYADLRTHQPCRLQGRPVWIRKEAIMPLMKALLAAFDSIQLVPSVVRKYDSDNRLMSMCLEDALNETEGEEEEEGGRDMRAAAGS
eukprot:gene1069-2097_t